VPVPVVVVDAPDVSVPEVAAPEVSVEELLSPLVLPVVGATVVDDVTGGP
jgi:hypothetical protein